MLELRGPQPAVYVLTSLAHSHSPFLARPFNAAMEKGKPRELLNQLAQSISARIEWAPYDGFRVPTGVQQAGVVGPFSRPDG